MTARGSITIGDVTFDIVDIYLAAGQVCLDGHLPPGTALRADHYELYDRNGQLVYRCARRFDLPALATECVITIWIAITDQTATPGQRLIT